MAACLLGASGCHLVAPEVSYQPLLHNPFPQFSRVAVAPFANQSDEPTVDGRQFAMAYFAELQGIRGFEVVPLGVVEEAMIRNAIDLSSPGEARRLAEILGVDVVVVGAVTDFSPYYPPRCGMRVEWYAANPGFHEIPAGYGLPWGTPEEEYIPEELVFEAEMALARAQMATQSPDCNADCQAIAPPPGMFMPYEASPIPTRVAPPAGPSAESVPPLPPRGSTPSAEPSNPPATEAMPLAKPMPQVEGDGWKSMGSGEGDAAAETQSLPAIEDSIEPSEELPAEPEALPPPPGVSTESAPPTPAEDHSAAKAPRRADSVASRGGAAGGQIQQVKFNAPIDSDAGAVSPDRLTIGPSAMAGGIDLTGGLPPDWPDARGFMPPGPSPTRPRCVPQLGPVMTHTRIYRGHDPDFTAALASYVSFRDDARFGGWQSYLERSDDFIRFCTHLHLAEMLTARGGGSETRVTRRWSESR
ncbi:MAG: hypothetical protein AAF589_04520 [Planctomycetota bacterium]